MATKERPAEFAILGLLATEQEGRHGYDLARSFAPGQPLGEILRLEPGMLYHHLKRLERSVSVTQTTIQSGSRPPRQVYEITDHGRSRLRKWLQSPVGHTREIRLDFLVKLYFAERLDPQVATNLISTQLAILREVRESMTLPDAFEEAPADQEARRFLWSVRTLRIAQTEAAIDWLESLQRMRESPVSGDAVKNMQ
ncbi:MAG: PadR family transcriptional regulator [Thermomicrobiales bacterium]